MLTYVHPKTQRRFPASGSVSSFSESKGRLTVFIQGEGIRKARKNEFIGPEEIPDLPKPFTRAQFVAYAGQYGVECAQEFLDCCDYSKPLWARDLLHPPARPWPSASECSWFKARFDSDPNRFADGRVYGATGNYLFDVLQFEKYLVRRFRYNPNAEGSLKDFITKTFGEEVCAGLEKRFITPR